MSKLGVLLAAGAGSRFGGAYPGAKLDQLMDGVSVGVRSFNKLASAADQMLVVVRDRQSLLAIHAAANGADVLENSSPERGIGHSIALAAKHALTIVAKPLQMCIYMADMPWIDNHTFSLLPHREYRKNQNSLNAEDHIVQLVYRPVDGEHITPRMRMQAGKPGHPVVFGRNHWPALAQLDGDQGARSVIAANRDCVMAIETADQGIWRDVDSPIDLQP